MNNQLKHRQYQILKMLSIQASPIDISIFKNKFKISNRTIYYDIDKINKIIKKYEIEIKYKTKQGFYIPTEQKSNCLKFLVEQSNQYIDDENERINQLFFYFLIKRKYYIEEIEADLYFSKSTIIKLISNFNTHFKNEIKIISYKSGGYCLKGDEYKIRNIAVKYLSNIFKGSYTSEDWYILTPNILKKYIDLRIITYISNTIKKVNSKYNVWISNTAFINLFSYCIIRYIRVNFYKLDYYNTTNNIKDYAEELIYLLDKNKNYINTNEIEYIRIFLNNNNIIMSTPIFNSKKLLNSINKIINMLQKNNNFTFDINTLHNDLYEHLKNSISIYKKQNKNEENFTVINEIKNKYSYFYNIAKKCSDILQKDFKFSFNDTETCYIAIYLYKNCIEKNLIKKNVLLVCATGKGLSHLLSMRVENVFPTIKIIEQTSPFHISNIDNKNIDFIISTIPLNITNIPIIKISRILSSEDIKRIQEFLDYGKLIDEIPLNDESNASFNSKLDPFLIQELDFININVNEISYYSTVVSKLILTLLEYTSKFPDEYKLNQDTLLCLTIHMCMAIPRWYNFEEPNENDILEYKKICKNHNVVFEIMEKFFLLVEKSLKISISIKERIAFFLYILY